MMLDLLSRRIPPDDARDIRVEAAAVDEEIAALPEMPAITGAELAWARLVGSGTLRRAADRSMANLAAWSDANALVSRWVMNDVPLDLERLRELNAAVLGAGPEASSYRATRMTLDRCPCPAPAELEGLLEPMLAAVDDRRGEVHAFAAAGLLYQWLISVHPFADGNGRTARLFADALLAQHGYPAMSFPTATSGLVAIHTEREAPLVIASTRVVVAGVRHTLALLRGRR